MKDSVKLPRLLISVVLALAVIGAILVLDPSLRPDWLRDWMNPDSPRGETSKEDGNSTATEPAHNPVELGLVNEEAFPEAHQLAPDFILLNLEGDVVRLSDFRGKKRVVLNFWASWCDPCIEEMPALEGIYQQYKDELVVLGVNVQEDPGAIRKFIDEEVHVTYPILLDSEGRVNLKYILLLPSSLFIDMDGKVWPFGDLPFKLGEFTTEELHQEISSFLSTTSEQPQ